MEKEWYEMVPADKIPAKRQSNDKVGIVFLPLKKIFCGITLQKSARLLKSSFHTKLAFGSE